MGFLCLKANSRQISSIQFLMRCMPCQGSHMLPTALPHFAANSASCFCEGYPCHTSIGKPPCECRRTIGVGFELPRWRGSKYPHVVRPEADSAELERGNHTEDDLKSVSILVSAKASRFPRRLRNRVRSTFRLSSQPCRRRIVKVP